MRSENMAKNASKYQPIAKIAYHVGNQVRRIQRWCQDFDRKLGNSLCA